MSNPIDREAVYAGVFTALQGLGAMFKTYSRRLRMWAETDPGDQPALFMMQDTEQADTNPSGTGTKWKLSFNLYIYAHLQPGEAPGPILNPLIDAVCNLLNAQNPITGRTTFQLPGVVFLRVEGTIQIDEGTLDNQAVAIIPVVILVVT